MMAEIIDKMFVLFIMIELNLYFIGKFSVFFETMAEMAMILKDFKPSVRMKGGFGLPDFGITSRHEFANDERQVWWRVNSQNKSRKKTVSFSSCSILMTIGLF